MTGFILKKCVKILISIFLLSFIVFFISAVIPGSFLKINRVNGMSEQQINKLTVQYNLDKPVVQRYVIWLSSALKGDFGQSAYFKKPVVKVINDSLFYSAVIGIFALFIEIGIAVPLGTLAAYKKGSVRAFIISVFGVVAMSTPVFFIAILFKRWFVFGIKLFPSSGFFTAGAELSFFGKIADTLMHIALPSTALALASAGALIIFTKNTVENELSKDYITAARARGLSEARILFSHALRNAAIPIFTYIMSVIPFVFAGALVVEAMFSISGTGKIAYIATLSRDYNLIMAYTLLVSLITLLCNTITEITYTILDPKIKLWQEE